MPASTTLGNITASVISAVTGTTTTTVTTMTTTSTTTPLPIPTVELIEPLFYPQQLECLELLNKSSSIYDEGNLIKKILLFYY